MNTRGILRKDIPNVNTSDDKKFDMENQYRTASNLTPSCKAIITERVYFILFFKIVLVFDIFIYM